MEQKEIDKKIKLLYEVEQDKKAIIQKEAELKADLFESIKELKKTKFYDMNITYVAGVERKTFDKKAFESANKNIDLSQYNKLTQTADSIRVSFEKQKGEQE